MLKKIKVACISLVIFLSIFLISNKAFYCYDRDMYFTTFNELYSLEEESIDLLFIGSSHAFTVFKPAIYNQALGLNTFILAGYGENVVQDYYNLKEALKRQKPKYVVLETFLINPTSNKELWDKPLTWTDSAMETVNVDANIQAISSPLIKLQMSYSIYGNEFWKSLLPIVKYHHKWKNIIDNYDSLAVIKLREKEKTLGFLELSYSTRMDEDTKQYYDNLEYDKRNFTLDGIGKIYLDKIVDVCKENNIELILVTTPHYRGYLNKINYETKYNELRGYALENKINYYDYNMLYNHIGLTSDDFVNERVLSHHMNQLGSQKLNIDLINKMINDFNLSNNNEKKCDNGLFIQHDLNFFGGEYSKLYFDIDEKIENSQLEVSFDFRTDSEDGIFLNLGRQYGRTAEYPGESLAFSINRDKLNLYRGLDCNDEHVDLEFDYCDLEWHEFSILADGNRLEVFIDNKLVANFKEDKINYEVVTFGGWNDPNRWFSGDLSNIKIINNKKVE